MPKKTSLTRSDIRKASWCALGAFIIAILLLIGGAVLSGIAYTEVRPNYGDENYDRFIGANVQRVMGPIMLGFGGILLVGCCAFFGFVLCASNNDYKIQNSAYAEEYPELRKVESDKSSEDS